MKAVLLAAGKGERLKSITSQIPKPMIKYENKPLIEHNIDLCKKNSITELFINTHHLSSVITGYLGDGSKYGVSIKYSYEPELLGTAGALNNFKEYLSNDDFLIIYSDNYSSFEIKNLINKKKQNNSICVIGFHYREDVQHSGVAEFNEEHRILRFIEKPKPGETESHWVNAGIYLFSHEVLKYIPTGFSDFGRDIFPELLKQNIPIYGVLQNTDVKAFDTPEMYNKNIK